MYDAFVGAGEAHASLSVGAAGRQAFINLPARPHGPRIADGPFHGTMRAIAYLAVFAWLTARYGRAVAQHHGIGLGTQIRQQLHLIFRDGINPKIYYFLELYRMWSADIGQQCVMRYEIKRGLLRALHRLRPKHNGRRVSLGNKLSYADHCSRFGLPSPRLLGVGANGSLSLRVPLQAVGQSDLFIKPEISRGARGALWFKRIGAGQYRSINGEVLSLEQVLKIAAQRSRRKNQLLQEALTNHPGIADFAEESLIVFRVFTCINQRGDPVVTHGMMRVLSKLEPRWHRGDEYAAAVDLATGALGSMCGDKSYGPADWYDTHPVTGAQVRGRIIQDWAGIRDLAIAGHHAFIQRMLLGWDVALTPNGPVLIEANAYPDTEFLQRVHRQPIGESKLGDLLAYHIARLSAVG